MWPHRKGDTMPRPCVVAITRILIEIEYRIQKSPSINDGLFCTLREC